MASKNKCKSNKDSRKQRNRALSITVVEKITTIPIQNTTINAQHLISCYISHISPYIRYSKIFDSGFISRGETRDSLPSGTILGSRGCRGGRADDAAARAGGDLATARRLGLPRRRRSVRGRRTLGREAGVVASILAADAVLLARVDANPRRQTGGAPSSAPGALGRRGGHPDL